MSISKLHFTFLLLGFCLATSQAEASLAGRASVIDGDTLEIHGQRIRLHGVDAPESDQLCKTDGKDYRCGQQAAIALAEVISNQTVRCEQRDTDQYGRPVAECFAGAVNLNAWIAERGWALAYREYSSMYVPYEIIAKEKGVGLWQGSFVAPWEYRRVKRVSKAKNSIAPDFKCAIKGNITSKGLKIYHVPGSRWYNNTSINPKKDERWFCSEEDARRAGWRAAQPN